MNSNSLCIKWCFKRFPAYWILTILAYFQKQHCLEWAQFLILRNAKGNMWGIVIINLYFGYFGKGMSQIPSRKCDMNCDIVIDNSMEFLEIHWYFITEMSREHNFLHSEGWWLKNDCTTNLVKTDLVAKKKCSPAQNERCEKVVKFKVAVKKWLWW